MRLAQQLPDLGRELEEARLLPRLRRSRIGEVDLDDLLHTPGARRHDDDARREEDRLGDRVRHEDDGGARRLPDPEQLEVEPVARHLVEGAERLVHQDQGRVERERPGDRDTLLHPAGELPRVVALEPGQLDELEQLLDALLLARSQPIISSGRETFFSTVRQSISVASWNTIP